MYLLFQKQRMENKCLQMWKEAWRMDSRTRKERSSYRCERLPIHSINHSYNFELPNKSNEANAMAHVKDQIFWAKMRDHLRRCAKSPTQSPNKRSISKVALVAVIKQRSIHESHVHQRTVQKKKELQSCERSYEKRTRWSCRIPAITSITWTDTFRKSED